MYRCPMWIHRYFRHQLARSSAYEQVSQRLWRNQQPYRQIKLHHSCSVARTRLLPEDSHLVPVFIALGSNLGDKELNIRTAIRKIEKLLSKKNNASKSYPVSSSFLYKSSPMYNTDQPYFFNAVCHAWTSLAAVDLLHELKGIEKEMGRDLSAERYGPRIVDLDILLYGSARLQSPDEKIIIPHPRMQEREFVLRPLIDLDPEAGKDVLQESASVLYEKLRNSQRMNSSVGGTPQDKLYPVTCVRFPNTGMVKELEWGKKTYSMGILNLTPDSFSEETWRYPPEPIHARLLQRAEFRSRFDILDIGGQSTRPGAKAISEEEEIRRVVPAIEEIRKAHPEMILSVDTSKAMVAKLAIEAGANIINDVSGGNADPTMLSTAVDLQVPIVLMHMRGTPETMSDLNTYENGLIHDVTQELSDSIRKAEEAGIMRWNILVDPGIGFSKIGPQNLEILQNLSVLKKDLGNYPLLVGGSRKSFIGDCIQRPTKAIARDWGTAAVVTASIAADTDIVRVHNPTLIDTVHVADAIYRSK